MTEIKFQRCFYKILIFCFITLSGFTQVQNPILPGFYPDPSICRVNDDYYLVNSSFSYFPGVPIFHSKDLSNWQQIGHVLNRKSQLNLTSEGMSGGIYAPSIRYYNNTFFLISTFIGKNGGNFYVTTKNPKQSWSDPIKLPDINGIDPDFFFDDDGKCYILYNSAVSDSKPLYGGHRSIWIQQYDIENKKNIGKKIEIVNGGTDITKKPIWVEGPHLFKKNNLYYLICAQDGTGYNHSEVVFKSKSVFGPYESYKDNPILSQKDASKNRDFIVTSTGHADFVETKKGDWVAVYLGCQPYEGDYYNTGRETFIQNIDWNSDWPIILEKGKTVPKYVSLPLPKKDRYSFRKYSANWKDDFDNDTLKYDWNFIRTPKYKWYTFKNSTLEITANNVPISIKGNPSFIGRRQQHAKAEFVTSLQLEKGTNLEAGIVAFQNENFFYKCVIEQQSEKYFISISSAVENFERLELNNFNAQKTIYLKISSNKINYQFHYSFDNNYWKPIGGKLDVKHLSSKLAGGYIGAYLGLYSFSKEENAKVFFDWAHYKAI